MSKILLSDIKKAREKIAPLVYKTPLVQSEALGSGYLLKLETAQKTGSFKVRGAASRLFNLTPEEKERGVATVSTGNHARAVSYVAKKLGISCRVFLSSQVPSNKVEAIQELGADLQVAGRSYDEAYLAACQEVEEKGKTLVPPFDDFHVIAGQGTIGLEILEDCPEIAAAIVPVSGGGLISGIALALKETNPKIKVIGVSMEKGAAMYESLKRGRPVQVEELDTLADSLKGGIGIDNKYTFDLTKKYVDDLILVSEKEIEEALKFAYFELKVILEGAAAVGLAAYLSQKLPALKGKSAFILSGKNVDMKKFQEVVKRC